MCRYCWHGAGPKCWSASEAQPALPMLWLTSRSLLLPKSCKSVSLHSLLCDHLVLTQSFGNSAPWIHCFENHNAARACCMNTPMSKTMAGQCIMLALCLACIKVSNMLIGCKVSNHTDARCPLCHAPSLHLCLVHLNVYTKADSEGQNTTISNT